MTVEQLRQELNKVHAADLPVVIQTPDQWSRIPRLTGSYVPLRVVVAVHRGRLSLVLEMEE